MGEVYNIQVMSYKQALEYVYNYSGSKEHEKYAIISIQEFTNGYGIGLKFKKGGNCLGALNIEFSDITKEMDSSEVKLMTLGDAQKIHDFVESLPDEVEKLIVHCYAGVSRSAAVAAGIAQVKFGDDKEYFKKYVPNMHVYYKILEVYGLSNKYSKD